MRARILTLSCVAMLIWLSPAFSQTPEEIGEKVDGLRRIIEQDQPMHADFDGVVEVGPEVAPFLEPLVHHGDMPLRVLGGVLAGRVAVEQGVNEELEQLLVQLANDSSAAVSFWGYHGLLKSPHVSEELAKEWTLKGLERRRPLAVRLLGADAAREREIADAAPWLAELIRHRKPDFERAKETIFVEEVEIQPEPAARPGTRRTDPRRTDPRRTQPGRRRFPDDDDLLDDELDDLDDDWDLDPDRRREREPKTETRPIKVGETQRAVVLRKGRELERHGAVEEIRRAGIALEAVTGEDFNFRTLNSWELEEAISRVAGWYEENKDRFDQIPDQD